MSVFLLTSNVTENPAQTDKSASIGLSRDSNEGKETVIKNDPPSEKKEEATVVMDGPLSHVYTQALKIAFAKESQMTAMPIEVPQEKEIDPKDLYVYAEDGNLDQTGLVTAMESLRVAVAKRSSGHVMLAIEMRHKNCEKAGLLESYARGLGIETFVSRRSALEAIALHKTKTKKV